jgi:hypothetical protein
MIVEQVSADEARQADLCDRVKRFLTAQHYASFRTLDVTVRGESVILVGTLPSFHERQLAVSFCQHVAGVYRVIDRLAVSRSPDGKSCFGPETEAGNSIRSPLGANGPGIARRDRAHYFRGA